jgi:hypothetical protein
MINNIKQKEIYSARRKYNKFMNFSCLFSHIFYRKVQSPVKSSIDQLESCYLRPNGVEFHQKFNGISYFDPMAVFCDI